MNGYIVRGKGAHEGYYTDVTSALKKEISIPVIMTGGIAKFVAPLCKTPVIYDRDLILKGLTALYRENRRS